MPTGLSNSPVTEAEKVFGIGATSPTPSIPRAAINRSVTMTFAATGVAQIFPPVHVPSGCSVYIRGGSGNTGIARVATDRETLSVGLGDPITKDTEINYPVDNTGQIWAVGTQGDSLTISLRGGTQNL
jgi:hypothetical protein